MTSWLMKKLRRNKLVLLSSKLINKMRWDKLVLLSSKLMNKMRQNKLVLLSSKLMNKMRPNKLVLLSSKLMNKMGRTYLLPLLFLDGLPKLAWALFCYENHSNGQFSKMGSLYANELTVWAPIQRSNILA